MKTSTKDLCPNLPEKQYRRDDENRIIVDMNVKDDTDFLSVFSATETPVISSEVAEFLENSTHSIRPNEQFTLRIKSNCIDETNNRFIKTRLKNITQSDTEPTSAN